MKKINFKLFFYITFIIIILELSVIFLSQKDKNDMYSKEIQERLNYDTSLIGERIEGDLSVVKVASENFFNNIESIDISENEVNIKEFLDNELFKLLESRDIIGAYYRVNIQDKNIENSIHFSNKENRYVVISDPDLLQELANENEGLDISLKWNIPFYVKVWEQDVGLYKEELKYNNGLTGVLILAIDSSKIESLISKLSTNNQYYFVNTAKGIIYTNNLELTAKSRKDIYNEVEVLKNKTVINNEKRGVITNSNKEENFESFYKFDEENLLIVRKKIPDFQNIQFFQKNIWFVLLFNIIGIYLIYIILKRKMIIPNEKINEGLLEISKKNLVSSQFLEKNKNKTYLYNNYNKVLISYSSFIDNTKENLTEADDLAVFMKKRVSDLLNKNLAEESIILNLGSELEKNQIDFDKVYNLIMENHKINTAMQNEVIDINRNINLLRDNFIKERENGDTIRKLINEINRISFQINVFGLNSTIEMYSSSGNSLELEESSKEIRYLANRIKSISEEIKILLKKEKVNFQLKNKSLNLITDYMTSFSNRFLSMKKSNEKEIVKYIDNKENFKEYITNLKDLREDISQNRNIYSKELYELQKLRNNLDNIFKMINEYKLDINQLDRKEE